MKGSSKLLLVTILILTVSLLANYVFGVFVSQIATPSSNSYMSGTVLFNTTLRNESITTSGDFADNVTFYLNVSGNGTPIFLGDAVNGSANQTEFTLSVNTATLPNLTYNLTVIARTGNATIEINATTTNLTSDQVLPNITIREPRNMSGVNKNPVSFRFFVDDRFSPHVSCNVTLDPQNTTGGQVINTSAAVSTGTSYDYNNTIQAGDHDVRFSCEDRARNSSSNVNLRNGSLLTFTLHPQLQINVTSIIDASGNLQGFLNNTNVTNTTGQMYINLSVTGAFNNYTCSLMANYTDPWANTTNGCVNNFGEHFCPVSPPVFVDNLSIATTNASLSFFLPNGKYKWFVGCVPRRVYKFTMNDTGFNQTVRNMSINEGDFLFINNTNTTTNITVRFFGQNLFGSAGNVLSSVYNITVNGSRVFTNAWSMVSGVFTPGDFLGGLRNMTVNISSGTGTGAANLTVEGSLNFNITKIIDEGGNITEMFVMNLSGVQGVPQFTFDTITANTSCTGDNNNSFCLDMAQYGGMSNLSFYFNSWEDCFNGRDDDGDALIDVTDPDCYFLPGASLTIGNDTVAPKIILIDTIEFNDTVFMEVDTDELANTSVLFYGQDLNCNAQSLNKTLYTAPLSVLNYTAHYTFFNMFNLETATLGYALTPSTTYFFKTKAIDLRNNTALDTDCRSFTTTATAFNAAINYTLGFTMPTYSSFSSLSGMNVTITTALGTQDINGFQDNNTFNQTRNFNLTFENTNQSYRITLIGVDLFQNVSINLSDTATTDFRINLNSSNPTVGFTHEAWQEMMQDLYVDEIEIAIASSTTTLVKCSDDGSNCVDVTSQARLVSYQNGIATWRIPISLGFSGYGGGAGGGGGRGSASGGGGGGGGGGACPDLAKIKSLELEMTRRTVSCFNVGSQSYLVRTWDLAANWINLLFGPDDVRANILLGTPRNVDINKDKIEDLEISVKEIIRGAKATVVLKYIGKAILPEVVEGVEEEEPAERKTEEVKEAVRETEPVKEKVNAGVWVLGVAALLVIGGVVYFYTKGKT